MVKLVWDFKGWMENSLINSHGPGDQFEFRIHTVDKERRYQFSTIERARENDGCLMRLMTPLTRFIRIGVDIQGHGFSTKSPRVCCSNRQEYLDRILKERCPKILTSGLLSSTEQQWWESFSSVVMTYLKTSRNVDFPLIHLIESVNEIPETLMSHPVETILEELEDKATKRALVYTGNYLPPKKRKAAEKSKKQEKK